MASDMLEDHLNEIGGATPRGQSVTVGGCDTRAAQWDPSAWLNDLFSYHTPRHDQLPKYQAIRSAATRF